MKYEIDYVSNYIWGAYKNDKPCKNAVNTETIWLEKDGFPPQPQRIWEIELDSVEDLIKLQKEIGDPLLIGYDENDSEVIYIYDDYIE